MYLEHQSLVDHENDGGGQVQVKEGKRQNHVPLRQMELTYPLSLLMGMNNALD